MVEPTHQSLLTRVGSKPRWRELSDSGTRVDTGYLRQILSPPVGEAEGASHSLTVYQSEL
jgi:hypothetical protein